MHLAGLKVWSTRKYCPASGWVGGWAGGWVGGWVDEQRIRAGGAGPTCKAGHAQSLKLVDCKGPVVVWVFQIIQRGHP
jgi:hypothetical protein